jgi:sterol desaturase/sphingolipid hydroxylase (fatty acid hydroxylase superfamily)
LLFYYLGSIVRYRPHLFEALAQGPYGALVADFIAAQPEQLLYLLASEMCRREVAKPAIV